MSKKTNDNSSELAKKFKRLLVDGNFLQIRKIVSDLKKDDKQIDAKALEIFDSILIDNRIMYMGIGVLAFLLSVAVKVLN